jgi:hypothetical protein
MGVVRDKITVLIPWIEPVLDYFDWRKRVIALAAGIALAGWSFVKDLPWPIIVVVGAAAMVIAAYALVFPAFVKLINVGVERRPNYSIWKHRKQFELYEAACLLAEREPVAVLSHMNGDSAAWLEGLKEAIRLKEIDYIRTVFDNRHIFSGIYHPYENTPIERAAFKKYCEARGRYPEFLRG